MNKELLDALLTDLRRGIQIEDNRLELKREWWTLGDAQADEEFTKDVAAIANTRGGDGHIVVGLDSSGVIHEAPISKIGKDKAEIQQIFIKRCEPPPQTRLIEYTLDGKVVTVIEVSRSYQRPHVVKKYRNFTHYIPVRKGTATFPATRADLDEMYADRTSAPIDAIESLIEDKSIRQFHEREDCQWKKGFYLRPILRIRNHALSGSAVESVALTIWPTINGIKHDGLKVNLVGVLYPPSKFERLPIHVKAGDSLLGMAYFEADTETANAIGGIQHANCEWETQTQDTRQNLVTRRGENLQLVR